MVLFIWLEPEDPNEEMVLLIEIGMWESQNNKTIKVINRKPLMIEAFINKGRTSSPYSNVYISFRLFSKVKT